MIVDADVDLVGHRCRLYAAERTKENTLPAMRSTGKVEDAWCEIDMWRLKDGTHIVWHDPTWRRVADPETLPRGLPAKVKDATWPQVRQIRTMGGARVPTLERMLRESRKLEMTVVVEIKNSVGDAAALAEHPRVWWYKAPAPVPECKLGALVRLRDAGARTGVKTSPWPECHLTPEQIAGFGTFVVENANDLAEDDGALLEDYREQGLRVIPKPVKRTKASQMACLGIDRVMVAKPKKAATWVLDPCDEPEPGPGPVLPRQVAGVPAQPAERVTVRRAGRRS